MPVGGIRCNASPPRRFPEHHSFGAPATCQLNSCLQQGFPQISMAEGLPARTPGFHLHPSLWTVYTFVWYVVVDSVHKWPRLYKAIPVTAERTSKMKGLKMSTASQQ